MLNPTLPYFDEPEGDSLPPALPRVIDAHVHIFPDWIFSAVHKWFDDNAWKIRYRMSSEEIIRYLLDRGVSHIVALQYAHKPGIARQLNEHMVDICKTFAGQVTGLATVFPGENDARPILQEAFDHGLRGLKLHAHVQCFDPTDPSMTPLLDCCQANGMPVLMHVSREPKSDAYGCDPHQLCNADKLEHVLMSFPDLKVCVPHLGVDEFDSYRQLIEKYDTLWLDTAMAVADYFQFEHHVSLKDYRPDRIIYGSDFPNIPYAWDRELKHFAEMGLTQKKLDQMLHENSAEFFSI